MEARATGPWASKCKRDGEGQAMTRYDSAGWTSMGPHLPMAAYHALEGWHPERIGALALYCSDGRWGEAFDEFCHHHLMIPRYDRWAVPGGPAWLADPDDSR